MQAFVIVSTPQCLAKEAEALERVKLQPVAAAHFSLSATRYNSQSGQVMPYYFLYRDKSFRCIFVTVRAHLL